MVQFQIHPHSGVPVLPADDRPGQILRCIGRAAVMPQHVDSDRRAELAKTLGASKAAAGHRPALRFLPFHVYQGAPVKTLPLKNFVANCSGKCHEYV
jgi:hypothetical protein